MKKITNENIDDIIRKEKRKLWKWRKNPKEYIIKWGKDGFRSLNKFYGAIVCSKHGITCNEFCPELGESLPKNKRLQFMGINHTWDKRTKNYKISKIK